MKMAEEKRGRGRPVGLNKTGGNKKGSVQAKNVATKNNLRLFVNNNFEEMTKEWQKIEDPYQKVMAFAKIMNFVYPQMRAVEFKGEEGKTSLEAKMVIMMQKTVNNEVEEAETEEVE